MPRADKSSLGVLIPKLGLERPCVKAGQPRGQGRVASKAVSLLKRQLHLGVA